MPTANIFGTRLRAAMRASGMRASDLARLCGVSPTTVGRWLLMIEADLAAKHAACIAEATGADLRHLITGNGKRKWASK